MLVYSAMQLLIKAFIFSHNLILYDVLFLKKKNYCFKFNFLPLIILFYFILFCMFVCVCESRLCLFLFHIVFYIGKSLLADKFSLCLFLSLVFRICSRVEVFILITEYVWSFTFLFPVCGVNYNSSV